MRTLYIGVSKRHCYCCSLFFKAVEENKSVDFSIFIVTNNGKLYSKWSRIEKNCFDKEYKQIWAKIIEDMKINPLLNAESFITTLGSPKAVLTEIRQ